MKSLKSNFRATIIACYTGLVTQAVVNNFMPLLFVTFSVGYGISLDRLTFLITVNFCTQFTVDAISIKFVDIIGSKRLIVAAQFLSFLGLGGLAVFPDVFPTAYSGLLFCVFVYAIGGGLIEVLATPIVEACPTKNKTAEMSLLHSFYSWGQVAVVLFSTVFFKTFGIENWKTVAALWSLIPLANTFLFAASPVRMPVEKSKSMPFGQLVRSKGFGIYVMLMLCAGASELGMSQWASAFAETGLGVSKSTGDLLGPCFFAVLMGLSRVFYAKFSERVDLRKFMILSSVLCIVSYLLAGLSPSPLLGLIGCGLCGLSVGILWPGTFCIASKTLPTAGTAMFAVFALAGDIGCTTGPSIVGFVADFFGGELKTGLLAAIVFPLVMLIGLLRSRGFEKSE